MFANNYNLYVDEAQYWFWSKHLDFGYYSKPPMIAYIIKLTTNICGDGEGCVRVSSPILYFFSTIFVYLIAEEISGDRKNAIYAAAMFLFMPAVTLSSTLITTDVALVFFYSGGIFFLIRALKTYKFKYFLLTAICCGLGMLSKYTMVFFAVAVLMHLAINEEHRKTLKMPMFWLAMCVCIAIFLPNLYWNIKHNFITVKHHHEISGVTGDLFSLKKFFEFFSAQFVVFGPINFGLLLLVFRNFREIQIWQEKLLLLMIVPFLLFITLLSFVANANANWCAPVYIASSVLITNYAFKHNMVKWLNASMIMHVVLAIVFVNYEGMMRFLNVEQTVKSGALWQRDPYYRAKGFDMFAAKVRPLLIKYETNYIVSDERKAIAELYYYLRDKNVTILSYNKNDEVSNHFDLKFNLKSHASGDFLYITKARDIKELANKFKQVKLVDNIVVKLYPDYSLDYKVYLLSK